jgi:hypothetical protein
MAGAGWATQGTDVCIVIVFPAATLMAIWGFMQLSQ